MSLWLLFCSAGNRAALDEFMGVWKTTADQYEERFFEIADATITFGIGDGKQDTCYIRDVTKAVEDKGTLYTITYQNIEETDFKLSFYYKQDDGGVIQFENRMDIEWTREK
jgi:hypothetical protein